MLLPAAIGILVFQYLPLADVLEKSLRTINPFTRAARGGPTLENYLTLLSDPEFLKAMLNTVCFIAVTVGLEIPLALVLAVMINKRLPGSRLLRATIIGAMAASETVAALVWSQMYESSFGLINAVLRFVGISAQPFLTSEHQALLAVAAMSAWRGVGLPMLIFLGGLQAIPEEVYEASRLDGSGPVRTLLQITVPPAETRARRGGFHVHAEWGPDLHPDQRHDRRRAQREHDEPHLLLLPAGLPLPVIRHRSGIRRRHAADAPGSVRTPGPTSEE
ncbi:carbohydrate ABC transporter permease [Arthrobacter woluwensis]|uniref:carbohydrate ABC transporter permease n=1 Tax=Arthrobacter woluwensis TaxID=156980 RepID=UPI001AAEB2AE|nr:sugar ABC transporter permease [Arthrobacter woluwensis]QTF72597.1 sugar ABC transporter permease [Arthrobacter woluwensis]